MDILENARTCLDYGNVNEAVLSEFTLSAVQSGITLMGGGIGSGKSSTTESFLQRLEKTHTFKTESIIYISAFELKDDDYRHVASGISDIANDLIKRSASSSLFVVIDEINSLDALNAAIALAEAGHSVLALVRTPRRAGLGAVLASAVSYVDVSEREDVAKRLIQLTNLFIEQPSHFSQTDGQPEYRYMSCPTGLKDALINNLDEYGLDYICKDILDAAIDYKGY